MENNLTKETLEYLVNLGKRDAEIHCLNLPDGEILTDSPNLYHLPEKKSHRPARFTVSTLSGLADFLLADVDHSTHEHLLVNVETPTRVCVYTPTYGFEVQRDLIASCTIDTNNLRTDCYMPADEFIVWLQTSFVKTPNLSTVMRFVGNMQDEQTNATADDGVSQRVTIKTGASGVSEVTVVNPVFLSPRRTFAEVDQPESPFILRLDEGPKAALFKCNDLTWYNEAIRNIGNYLRERLKDDPRYVVIA